MTSAVPLAALNLWHPLIGTEKMYGTGAVSAHFGFEASDGGGPAGIVAAHRFDELVVFRGAVRADARGTGLGRLLLRSLLDDAAGSSVEATRVGKSPGARHLLGHHGFSPSAEQDFYLHDVSHAPPPPEEFVACSAVPSQHRERVTELGRQYCAATGMPLDFDVFEDFASDDDGFMVLGIASGVVWGVAVACDCCTPGWGTSERLLVSEDMRGRGLSHRLKLAQLGAARRRGWTRMIATTAVGDAASRANARAGGRVLRDVTWRREA